MKIDIEDLKDKLKKSIKFWPNGSGTKDNYELLLKALEQQQAEIKARNDVLTQFINRFDSTNDEHQETYQAAVSLLNKHLIKS